MRSRLLAALLVVSATGCASFSPETDLTPTSSPVTRIVRNQPAPVLRAGTQALRGIGFEVSDPGPGAVRVFSEPMTIQSVWRGAPISQRVICGMGLAAPTDTNRTSQLANTIPVELRLGYEVESRPEATAATIIFIAEGRRAEAAVPTSPTMSCTLTVPFVNELFRLLEEALRAEMATPS